MFLKIFGYSFVILGMCFSVNAMNFAEVDIYFPPASSPTKSPTTRKSVKRPEGPYTKLEEGTQLVVIYGPYGQVTEVYEDLPCSQENVSELEKIQKSLKTDTIFYNSHAVANTLFLSGVFYYSPELFAVSALYMGCCAIVYGAFSIDTNIKCAESQNLESQNILTKLSSFQRTQACLNMMTSVCFMGGGFAEVPEVGYALGGVFLASAVGNSFFFGCAS
jgi:hypothetical protein